MVPAHQGLDPADHAGAQIILGLVVQDQVAVDDRAPHLAHQRQVGGGVAIGHLVEHRDGLARIAGLVEGDIGPLDHRGHALRPQGVKRQAGCQADVDRGLAQGHRSIQRRLQLRHRPARLVQVTGAHGDAQHRCRQPRHV